jgi:hypothetical protein
LTTWEVNIDLDVKVQVSPYRRAASHIKHLPIPPTNLDRCVETSRLSARSEWSESRLAIGGSHKAELGLGWEVRTMRFVSHCAGSWNVGTRGEPLAWSPVMFAVNSWRRGDFFVRFIRVGDVDGGEGKWMRVCYY